MFDKKVLMLIVITFSVVVSLTTVKAHYIPDDEHEVSSEEDYSSDEPSKVSEFFTSIKCGISHGAKKIRDGVVSGYEYVRDKLTPNKSKPDVVDIPANVSEIFPTPTVIASVPTVAPPPKTPADVVPSDQPLFTLPTRTTEMPPPVWDATLIDVRGSINDTDDNFTGSATTQDITLDNRNLFDAPSNCKEGERADRSGRCRKVI